MVVSMKSRRKSIAVPQEDRSALHRKKRAHSLGPSKLSPLSRSRLSIGNVKGILKSRPSSTTSTLRAAISPTQPIQSQSSVDENDATVSMDLTQDYHEPINDNFSRKSMGRRVSFRKDVFVRTFDKDRRRRSASQDFLGGRSSDAPSTDDPPVFNDENAYPGANARRLSNRKSTASEDMDMTSASIGAFINEEDNSTLLTEEDPDLDDRNSDMDVTQSFPASLRRRSSVGAPRVPLSQISSNPSQDQEASFTSEQSYTSEGDQSEIMDMTAPLGKPLRPAHHDEAWLALVKVTHSGNASIAPSDDSDTDGVDEQGIEALVARDADRRYTVNFNELSNDSISEPSFEDVGDQTLNLSQVIGTNSFGFGMGRPSVASSMDMDESEIFGNIIVPSTSTFRSSIAQSQLPNLVDEVQTPDMPVFTRGPDTSAPKPSVFKPPPETSPKKVLTSNLHPPAKSPVKSAPKSYSAAFAPPVARPTPKKSAETTAESSQGTANKRERTLSAVNVETIDRPSPAKRQAPAATWSNKLATEKPRILSPIKRTASESSAAPEKPTNIRRPSGYFARKKSLGTGIARAASVEQEPDLLIKMDTLGSRRTSMNTGASDAWKQIDESASWPSANIKGRGQITFVEQPEEEVVSASPSLDSQSAPISFPVSESMENEASPAPKTPIVDLSVILENSGFDDEEEGDRIVAVEGGPAQKNTMATEQWRNAIPGEGYAVDEVPPISIEQFFEMTGIKFMDLTAPRRRSTHASQLLPQDFREPSKIPLAEYAVAMAIDVPQLDHYSRVSRDLERWMEQSELEFEQMEEEAAKMTPELFAEYSQATSEEQGDMLHQLQLIRTNTRLQAKSDWYKWKLQWINNLKYTAQNAFTNLQNDAKALETLKGRADEIVPELQREYDEVLRELEAEQQEVAEIEKCDQEYLNELKNSIAEQNVEVESLRAEVKEGYDQLQWLQERLEGISLQKRENTAAIAEANRRLYIQTHSTQAEVRRLHNELEALEDIHMFQVIKVHSDVFEYVYACEYRVTIPCEKHSPLSGQIDIVSLPEMRTKYKDDFPRLSSFLVNAAKEYIRSSGLSTTRQVVQRLGGFWSSTTQVRAQLRQLSIKYPVEIEPRQTPGRPFSEFAAQTMVLFPAKKAKAYISFIFNLDTFSRWPITVDSLRWEVKVAYGPIDGEWVSKAVEERMKEVTASENYACLIDACIEAQEVCG